MCVLFARRTFYFDDCLCARRLLNVFQYVATKWIVLLLQCMLFFLNYMTLLNMSNTYREEIKELNLCV